MLQARAVVLMCVCWVPVLLAEFPDSVPEGSLQVLVRGGGRRCAQAMMSCALSGSVEDCTTPPAPKPARDDDNAITTMTTGGGACRSTAAAARQGRRQQPP